jgi:hypothetical protein
MEWVVTRCVISEVEAELPRTGPRHAQRLGPIAVIDDHSNLVLQRSLRAIKWPVWRWSPDWCCPHSSSARAAVPTPRSPSPYPTQLWIHLHSSMPPSVDTIARLVSIASCPLCASFPAEIRILELSVVAAPVCSTASATSTTDNANARLGLEEQTAVNRVSPRCRHSTVC